MMNPECPRCRSIVELADPLNIAFTFKTGAPEVFTLAALDAHGYRSIWWCRDCDWFAPSLPATATAGARRPRAAGSSRG